MDSLNGGPAGAGSPSASEVPSPIPQGHWDVQVAVIGGGPGGEDCARELADHGVRVAMIDNAPYPGGECLWRGCIPSKAWRHVADLIRNRAHDAIKGVLGTANPTLDWATLEVHRRDVQETRGDMALKADRGMRIEVIPGYATFKDAHTLRIRTVEGDVRSLRFGAAVIATGAPPFLPPIPGAREGLMGGGVLTSDSIWELPQPPNRLGIIGGGVTGVEMAQIWRDFGAEILMLEARQHILPGVEEEIAKTLTAILEKEIKLVTGASVTEITGEPGNMMIKYADAEGVRHHYLCGYVLVAAGKRPDTSSLNLDAVGVELDGPAIRADAAGRTSVPHIYAVGDVTGGHMLAHTAAAKGRVAAANLLGQARAYDPALDCGVIFSRPQTGFVGLSLAQAKARGIDATEVRTLLAIDAKAMISLQNQGMIKLVADKASQKVIGAHFLADHTDTLIGAAVMMVSAGMTLTQVAQAIFPHPTQTELFGELARRLLARLRRTMKR
jgi:dihydrolipoyl dehydrogenase